MLWHSQCEKNKLGEVDGAGPQAGVEGGQLFWYHLKGALKTSQPARNFGGCFVCFGGKIPGWLPLNQA